MTEAAVDVVTGAFGYSGRYIARRLLADGRRVRTITGRPSAPSPFGDDVEAAPFHFHDPDALAETLRGADTLYNTYWVRFPYGDVTYESAIANTRTLFAAAMQAGVRRLVHISITNPSEDSPLPYFRGKALLERELRESGLSHAIVRPTVVFGREDILVNNIAWLLRRFPLFLVPGTGDYRLQPVFVEDLAEIAVAAGRREDDLTTDAVGPETFTFEELVRLVADIVGSRARILHARPGLALALSRIVGRALGDVLLTADEVEGLTAGLLVSTEPPTGRTRLSAWLREHRKTVGRSYASELARHYRSDRPGGRSARKRVRSA